MARRSAAVRNQRPRLMAEAAAWADRDFTGECPVRDVLDRLGDTWTVLLVLNLSGGPRRFAELKRNVTGISQRMLTETLRRLERDGLVARTVTPSRPPRVDYELTDLGRTLLDPLRGVIEWSFAHHETVRAARARYDRSAAAEASARIVTR